MAAAVCSQFHHPLRSCNGHASSPEHHATCKLGQSTKGHIYTCDKVSCQVCSITTISSFGGADASMGLTCQNRNCPKHFNSAAKNTEHEETHVSLMFRCTKLQHRSTFNAIDGGDLYFFTGGFSSDIHDYKTPCVRWPGHHQWVHYEQNKRALLLEQRGANMRGKSGLHEPQRRLVCKMAIWRRKGWLRQTQALYEHDDFILYSEAGPNSDPPSCRSPAQEVKYRPPRAAQLTAPASVRASARIWL